MKEKKNIPIEWRGVFSKIYFSKNNMGPAVLYYATFWEFICVYVCMCMCVCWQTFFVWPNFTQAYLSPLLNKDSSL